MEAMPRQRGGAAREAAAQNAAQEIMQLAPFHETSILKQIFVYAQHSNYLQFYIAAALTLLPLLLRCALSVNPHSGQGKAPRFGDFEAQRHWMEVTVNLGVGDWYRQTPENDLEYWGLDYPPLTAYGSWIWGKIAQVFVPSLVQLHESHGLETPEVKYFMRLSVILSDILLLFPGLYYFFQVYLQRRPWSHRTMGAMLALCQPALIIIDHGHFQYNGVSLGLCVISITLIFLDWNILGGVVFCLCILYKQIGLYYSLAFFFYLLRKCISPLRIKRLFWLGVAVVTTFAAVLLPFLNAPIEDDAGVSAPAGLAGLRHVMGRVFPFKRGVFEDKVANFWCVLSFVWKFRRVFDSDAIIRMSTSLTMLASSFSSLNLLMRAPSRRRFLLGLFNSSMSFFLFSYMVHEKSILFPLLPASLLVLDSPLTARVVLSFVSVSMFSMYPLLVEDRLTTPYFVLQGLYAVLLLRGCESIFSGFGREYPGEARAVKLANSILKMSYFGMTVIHALIIFVPVPAEYPDIFTYAIMAYSFAHFILFFILGNYGQYHYADETRPSLLSRERIAPKKMS